VEPAPIIGRWRARYAIPEGTRVSIIIASGGKTDILRTNVDSILSKTQFENYEIVVIDNSKGTAIEKLVGSFRSAAHPVRYIDWRKHPFNYSVINNNAARQCDSPVLLFLNDDTSVIHSDWLDAMVELIVRPEVGGVGAKLLYPNGSIQHAGVVMGLYDNCGHAFKGLDGSSPHYFDFSDVIRNVSAVTGACLMTRADVFREAGGFDENDFAVAFNDVDLCLKIGKLGYRVLYTPHAVLNHYEAFSKTSKDLIPHPEEVRRMQMKWAEAIAADPYYSPNLTRNKEDYSLRTKS
jgi:GT2 family glycosyltransferase